MPGPEVLIGGPRLLWALSAFVVFLAFLSLVFGVLTLLLRLRNERTAALWDRLESRWEGPVLEALHDPDRIEQLQTEVEPEHRLRFVNYALRLARRVRGEEREVLERIALPFLEPLARGLTEKRVGERARAVQTLGALGLPAYEKEVLAALDDPSPLVAMIAARALCRRRDPEYLPFVLERLHRFDGWSRRFLVSMLVSVGAEAGPLLRAALADREESPRIRAVAAAALAELGHVGAGDPASRVVRDADDPDLLASALQLLAAVGEERHLSPVRDLISHPHPRVRSEALTALGVLGGEDDVPSLLGALADSSPWVALRAARGILSAGGDALLEGLADSDHPRASLVRQVLVEERG